MHPRLALLLRSARYALRGGFLIRPLVIAVLLGMVGAILSSIEEEFPEVSGAIPTVLFPSHQDAQVAQVVLSSIATSIMTVVSIVFAILLMTLTDKWARGLEKGVPKAKSMISPGVSVVAVALS